MPTRAASSVDEGPAPGAVGSSAAEGVKAHQAASPQRLTDAPPADSRALTIRRREPSTPSARTSSELRARERQIDDEDRPNILHEPEPDSARFLTTEGNEQDLGRSSSDVPVGVEPAEYQENVLPRRDSEISLVGYLTLSPFDSGTAVDGRDTHTLPTIEIEDMADATADAMADARARRGSYTMMLAGSSFTSEMMGRRPARVAELFASRVRSTSSVGATSG